MEERQLPLFRMDFYMQAALERELQLGEDSEKLLETLRSITVLKNVKMTEIKSANESYVEYEGSIEVSQGSKAFLALLKHKDEKEPYNIFLRIDVNKEAGTREEAEARTREWIEATFAPPLTNIMGAVKIKTGTPIELRRSKKIIHQPNQ